MENSEADQYAGQEVAMMGWGDLKFGNFLNFYSENLIFVYFYSELCFIFLNFIVILNLLTEKTRSISLQQVKGTVVTNAECMDDYGILNITTKMFCVSSPVQSACQVTKFLSDQ